jgi:hypothetical protein
MVSLLNFYALQGQRDTVIGFRVRFHRSHLNLYLRFGAACDAASNL